MIQEENSTPGTNNSNDETNGPTTTQSEETNSLTQSLNALKTYNPKIYYQVDSYVDALDSYSTWRNAKILQVMKDDTAKLNFDGWSNKWDEVSVLCKTYG